MQPHLKTRDGATIPLTDEIYEAVLKLVKHEPHQTEPAATVEELEIEFSDLFDEAPKTSDLLEERRREIEREERKLERIGR